MLYKLTPSARPPLIHGLQHAGMLGIVHRLLGSPAMVCLSGGQDLFGVHKLLAHCRAVVPTIALTCNPMSCSCLLSGDHTLCESLKASMKDKRSGQATAQ